MAQNTRGVSVVDDQLTVALPKPGVAIEARVAMHEARVEVSDVWITTKVKSTLMYSRNVDGYAIAVTTRAGVVTLTGKVSSVAERDLAVWLARNVRGVTRVQSRGLTL